MPKGIWGWLGLRIHGVNLLNIPDDYEGVELSGKALEKAREELVDGEAKLIASAEDHLLYCILRSTQQPVLLDVAIMLVFSQPLEFSYLFARAAEVGLGDEVKQFLGYVLHVVKNGWAYDELSSEFDIYYRVAKRFFELYPDADTLLEEVEEFRGLSPYEVIREAWKQIEGG